MHTLTSSPATHNRDRRFVLSTTLVIVALVTIGFGYAAYARLVLSDPRFGGPTLSALVRIHAVVSTAWIILLLVQAYLIRTARTRLHRRIGAWGAAIAALLVVFGGITAIRALGRGVVLGGEAAVMSRRLLIMPTQELFVFALLVGAALWLRGTADAHKRLMLLGTMALIPAATTRPFPVGSLPFVMTLFGLPEVLFVVALMLHDRRTQGRLHVTTKWGGAILAFTAVARIPISQTSTWLAVATVLLPGP